ncbi:MAG TPA: recombinase family protein [Coleofasciculaceae cyanobacterium]
MNAHELQVAIYARVSSEQQATAHTIASQLAALVERVSADGYLLQPELQFVDEGYSGASLVRPALEQLRDLAAAGAIDRLYVHSPDRLARNYAYQVLLVDELHRAGVEIIFLNRALGQSPEDDLLLQVQGMVAEYERAKILERSRRGKRHAAHSGSVNSLSGAPYGYRYIDKQAGNGQARYQVCPEQAQVVQQIFAWVGYEHATIGEVCRRLQQAEVPSPTGKPVWDRSTVWGVLKNPAYKGTAAFGKTAVGQRRPRLRPHRNQSPHPRRDYSCYDQDPQQWILIPVPALVDEALFATVQQQLQENQKRARQRQRGATYLLQGLLVCKQCGYSYYGKPVSNKAAKGKTRNYAYYRCIGTDAYRFGGQRICSNTQVRTDLLEVAVWQQVRELLENPQRLEQEYLRRGQAPVQAKQQHLSDLETQVAKLRRGMGRLIDSYTEGLIEKTEFEPRITQLRERICNLETQLKQASEEIVLQRELRLIIGRLEDFASKVKTGLEQVDWQSQREIIRTLVKRVEIDQDQVNVVFKVEPSPPTPDPSKDCLQHCTGREGSVARGDDNHPNNIGSIPNSLVSQC